MELNGSQIVLECLLEQGVDTVFGYPGGAILNIYDALYHYQDNHHLHTLLYRAICHPRRYHRLLSCLSNFRLCWRLPLRSFHHT